MFLVKPAATDGSLTILGRVASTAYPTADVLLLALLARLLIGAGVHNTAFRLLASSLVIMLIGDVGFAVLAEVDAFTNNNVINITWLLAYVLFGAAALHPSMAKLSERAIEQSHRLTRKRLSLLTSVSLVAPILLLAQAWWHSGIDTAAIGIGAIVLFLLVVARMSGLIRQVEEQAARLETLAQHDPLTGAANRRAWDHSLPVEMDRARRTGTPLALALLDLDHFKTFNDQYGHQAGDQLLKSATATWQSLLRPSDLLARIGGEEFGVVLPTATMDQAVEIVDGCGGSRPSAKPSPPGWRCGTAPRPPTRSSRAPTMLSTRPSRPGGTRSSQLTPGRSAATPPPRIPLGGSVSPPPTGRRPDLVRRPRPRGAAWTRLLQWEERWPRVRGRPPSVRTHGRSAMPSGSLRGRAPLAQLAEQCPLKATVRGSSPWRRTRGKPQLTAPEADQAQGAVGVSEPAVFRLCSVTPRNRSSSRARSALSASGKQMAVAVQHEADRGVPGPLGDLLRGGAGRDPQRHRRMPQVMDAQPVEVRGDHGRTPDVLAEVGDPQHLAAARPEHEVSGPARRRQRHPGPASGLHVTSAGDSDAPRNLVVAAPGGIAEDQDLVAARPRPCRHRYASREPAVRADRRGDDHRIGSVDPKRDRYGELRPAAPAHHPDGLPGTHRRRRHRHRQPRKRRGGGRRGCGGAGRSRGRGPLPTAGKEQAATDDAGEQDRHHPRDPQSGTSSAAQRTAGA